MKHALAAGALTFCLGTLPANAASGDFLNGMSGNWAGSGKAYLRGLGNVGASCNMKGSGDPKALSMNGRCGVLFFKIGLGLRLKDAGGGRFTGVYTGSRTGPAALSGSLEGDKLTMNITWGGEVNGDRSATMILKRTGAKSFSQTVFDNVGGKNRQTSRFTFQKK